MSSVYQVYFFYTVHTERLVVDLARGGVGFEVLV